MFTPVTAARSLFSATARIERPILVEASSQPTKPIATVVTTMVIAWPGEARIGPITKTSAWLTSKLRAPAPKAMNSVFRMTKASPTVMMKMLVRPLPRIGRRRSRSASTAKTPVTAMPTIAATTRFCPKKTLTTKATNAPNAM